MNEDTDRFAREYIDAQKAALERNDFSDITVLEDSSVVFRNINGTVFNGRDAHLQAIRGMQYSFNGASITQDWQYFWAAAMCSHSHTDGPSIRPRNRFRFPAFSLAVFAITN